MGQILITQIFLHLTTGDPTLPYGASSRRSHGEQNHVGDPKRPNCYKPKLFSSKVDEYWPSTPTPLSHWRKIFNNSSAVHFFSSGTTKLFSYFFSSVHTSFFNYLTSGSAKLKVPREPQYCAYALLGPHYCPLSYFGSPDFWSSLKSSGTPLLSTRLFWITRFLIKPYRSS